MAFELRFKKTVLKDLQDLPQLDQERLLEAIHKELAPSPYQGKALTGEFKGLYRWRVGRFRIVYEIQKSPSVVLILRIGLRKDVYR
ncbi:Type II toxin-antitoxin system RelE/ParE family toxin [Nitrospira tepida]|uniref:Type II toxin-antitoxin system RelE/ParE family toxin n=1 Tax=Nitrospira tepida TaxID=2973512 RepID=A0AA86MX89_9BACT|nr:type II toxin-antitoxin system RelE/ParE family toxin [Nitrospira tepida]CAI4030764.1 Type II toxin-antitoxin system RelE/ParE family toxin [Nitrospira tepida]